MIIACKRKQYKKTTNLTLPTTPQLQPTSKPRTFASLALRQRSLYGRTRRCFTGKELDSETGLYYYGARYLDPKTGRWISGDPAVGEYIPSAPVNDEARKRNGNLPGMGGVFNYVNLHVYHYAGNNPVKYVDPDGEDIIDADTTKEQFDEMNRDFSTGEVDYWASSRWNGMQSFLAENPNGAYYRALGEMHWQQYDNKNDIEIIDPNSPNVDLMSALMIGRSLFSAGRALANGLTKSPAQLQQIANQSIKSGAKGQQLFKLFDGKIRLEKGVEAVNKTIQKELGVKVAGAIEKPWHLVVNGTEIKLNPLNPLWKFFPKK